jgi:hypothetical protein
MAFLTIEQREGKRGQARVRATTKASETAGGTRRAVNAGGRPCSRWCSSVFPRTVELQEAGSLVATLNRPDLRCYSLSTRTTSRWVISPKRIPWASSLSRRVSKPASAALNPSSSETMMAVNPRPIVRSIRWRTARNPGDSVIAGRSSLLKRARFSSTRAGSRRSPLRRSSGRPRRANQPLRARPPRALCCLPTGL